MTHQYHYLCDCVRCDGPNAGDDINAMVDSARDITRRTFREHVDLDDLREIEACLGYESHPTRGLTMASDWAVSYHKGTFRNVPAVYFRWSAIEHIFTQKEETAL